MTTPTVYTKPGCFPCKKTIEKFRDAGIEPRVADLTETPVALDYVCEELGYSQAPIVVIDDDFHWAGLNPDCIDRAITALTRTTD